MSEAAEFRGAHAPRVLRSAPSPIVLPNDRNFGEGAENAREGACAPQIHHEF